METKKASLWKSYRFPLLLIGSIVVGCLLGWAMGEKATVLKPDRKSTRLNSSH